MKLGESIAIALFASAITIFLMHVTSPCSLPSAVSAQSSVVPTRLDFMATEGQVVFPTSPVFPTSILVYWNGLLATPGASADYTVVYIQGGARARIVFNQPLHAATVSNTGDRVTLLYWR